MKFVYQYRTSDNVLHSDVVDAASRDAAFAKLKACGIRPGRMEEAPGFFNKLLGKGKRWIAIGILSGAVAISVFLAQKFSGQIAAVREANESVLTRRQVYGDPALMRQLAADNYETVFETEADRFLAHFAQPADVHRFSGSYSLSTDRQRLAGAAFAKLVANHFRPEIILSNDDPREVRELKRIVMWMRNELRAYLQNGNGTPESYVRRLEERQQKEAQIFNLARVELEREKDPVEWEKRNDELRAIGAPTIPVPSEIVNAHE